MEYISTRDILNKVQSHIAIKKGIAEDGGLFVPTSIPKFSVDDINSMVDMSYIQRACLVLGKFLTDFTHQEIEACVKNAYGFDKFDNSDIAPVHKLNDSEYVLELWHGPTCAFKDMALQLLPHLLTTSIKKSGDSREVVILTATSGDTGKAALEGFKNVNGTKIIVFFPKEGVSDVQKLQMLTQEGENTFVIAIEGNFDDAQTGVKNVFTDNEFNSKLDKNGYVFSSANSINLGRLVPQVVYYFSSYADMVKNNYISKGEKINVVVPTGNFGNILAAFYAKEMGLPIEKLICASNENNVLTEFIKTGEYNRNRKFITTVSPSMDILISSNLERLLFYYAKDKKDIVEYMNKLKTNGSYTVKDEIKNEFENKFYSDYCNDKETKKIINDVFSKYNYIVDTHTAVAVGVLEKYKNTEDNGLKTIIVATASPFKFSDSVLEGLNEGKNYEFDDSYNYVNELASNYNLTIPQGLKDINKKEIKHNRECQPNKMKEEIKSILSI
jgi:threonine synthase